jgi:hypothetical protein
MGNVDRKRLPMPPFKGCSPANRSHAGKAQGTIQVRFVGSAMMRLRLASPTASSIA